MIRFRILGAKIFGFLGSTGVAPPGTEFITTEIPEILDTELGEDLITEGT